MATKQGDFTKPQHDAMEVHGFDLLAQVEAMLRHVREYQREVQRLRGILGKGQTTTSNRSPFDATREHVTGLRDAWGSFGEVLMELEHLIGQRTRTPDHGSARRELPRSGGR